MKKYWIYFILFMFVFFATYQLFFTTSVNRYIPYGVGFIFGLLFHFVVKPEK